jgi:Bardet-Biedl syndrome 5 protein
MLPDEQLVSRRTGVWNLSYEQGNLGVLVVTNVRLVWFADKAENFNVSIPWIEMRAVALREHSVGPIMVVETSERGGGYTLGFRFADAETLQQAVREAVSCHGVYTAKPVFGVKAVTEARTQAPEQVRVSRVTDDVAVERTAGEGGNLDLLQAYFGDEVVDCDRAPELDAYLGLAVETVREGLSLDELWHVIS